MKRLAIIPARSGSKGLKDKNIIDLCGKPLIAYTVEAATKCELFDSIIVSTDSTLYGNIALEYGAEVMLRDSYLANDTATTYMVIEDVLKRIKMEFDYFALLQPTSPFRTAIHIKEAITLFESKIREFDFLVSVKEAEHARALINPLGDDGSLRYFDTDFSNYKRQLYKEYTPNGAIFLGKEEPYLRRKHFFGSQSLAYIMNELDSTDIDTPLDYEFAQYLIGKGIGTSER